MSEERCDCCDLPVPSCGKAAEQRQRAEAAGERREALRQAGAIPARYAGVCSRCEQGRFREGDPIMRDPGGRFGIWRALLCCPGPT